MKLAPDIYIQLIRFLSGLYDAKSAPRIVRAAGMNPGFINFEQSAMNVWTEVVEQAEMNNSVEALLETVSGDFNNDMLRFFTEKIRNKEAFIQEQETRAAALTTVAATSNLLNCLVRVSRVNGAGSGNGCLISKDGLILTAAFIFGPGDEEVVVYNKTLGTARARIIQSWPDEMTALVKTEPPEPTGFLTLANTPPAVPDISTLAGYDYEHMKPMMINGRYLDTDGKYLYYDFPYSGKGLAGAPVVNEQEEILGMFVSWKHPGQTDKKVFGCIPASLIKKITGR